MPQIIENLQKTKAFFIHIFQGGIWKYLTLLSILEVIIQSLVCYFENDFSLNNMWHVIGWSIWLIICIIVGIVRRINQG
jgi:hypothetical protein